MPKHSMAELARLRFRGREMLKVLANDNKVPVRDIVGRYNDANLVAIRVQFIKWAAGLGMGSVVAGRLINRHHTTILHHRGGWRERKYAATKARAEARHGG